MSNSNKEFEEWRNMVFDKPNYLGKDLVLEAWNHQQKKIDELAKSLGLAESSREAHDLLLEDKNKEIKEYKQTILRMAEGMDYYASWNSPVNKSDMRVIAREIQKETASVVEKLRGKE